MNKRLREIEARMQEIRTMLQGDGEIDLAAIQTELNSLTEERSRLTQRQAMLATLGTQTTAQPAERAGEQSEARRADAGSVEYRDAWAAAMMGASLTAEQSRILDEVNQRDGNGFVHSTANSAILVPDTVVAGIWKRAEEAYPLWRNVRKFAVRGTLKAKRHTAINAGDAAWYDDDQSAVTREENAFGEIELTGCELAKAVTVSWKLRAMAVPEFISFITQEIGDRMGVALGTAVWSGKGKPGSGQTFKPEPRGIKTALDAESGTPQVVGYTTGSLKEADLRNAVAKVHSSYIGNGRWYANNTTVWTILAGIQDANKRSILVPDTAHEGAVGMILGKPVEVDAGLADGEVLFGDAQMYWANVNEPMTMHNEDHVLERETDYMGYAIVDGDVFDSKAFAYLKPATA